MKFVFIGSKSEKEYVQKVIGRIRSRSNNVINTAGEVDLSCLAEIIKRSVCMITNDSGPMHLSAALKVPVFALFGPETPQLFAPLGDNHTVFYKQLYCSPCHNIYNSKICNCENDNRCLKEIRVNDVYEKVDEFLIQQNKQ
jgi:heptosyltransferase-2